MLGYKNHRNAASIGMCKKPHINIVQMIKPYTDRAIKMILSLKSPQTSSCILCDHTLQEYSLSLEMPSWLQPLILMIVTFCVTKMYIPAKWYSNRTHRDAV